MKNILFVTLLFVSHILTGQVIIGKTVKIGGYTNIEVAQYNFPYKMTWDEAKDACKELGSRWRLPTHDELSTMYYESYLVNHIPKFNDGIYWSSSEVSYTEAWAHSFGLGSGDKIKSKDEKYLVRAVRSY
jgi:hypothetical protein